MTKGKVIIVALVALGVLFALGLGTNLLTKPKDEEYYREHLIGSMDDLLGGFSPQLDVRRLSPPLLPKCKSGESCWWLEHPRAGSPGVAKCNRDDNVLTITGSAVCGIKIQPRMPGCDDDYQSTTLKLAKGATATRAALGKLKLKAAVLMQAQKTIQFEKMPSPAGPKLKVTYQPNGKSEESVDLQGDKEIRLVVLEAGGTLTLRCTAGCSKKLPVEVILATRTSCS